jgi:hypothetical protein
MGKGIVIADTGKRRRYNPERRSWRGRSWRVARRGTHRFDDNVRVSYLRAEDHARVNRADAADRAVAE